MGYSAHLRDSRFRIDADRKRAALATIKALFSPQLLAQHGGKYSWVDAQTCLATRSLAAMLEEWGWPIKIDEDDNVIGISFDAGDNKLGDEDVLFGALAPFVQAGSYLAMVGEDGEHWRWYFDGQTCQQQHAKVTYD